MRLKIILAFLLAAPFISLGQNQLILFNRERVLARFVEGDDFIYKLKKSKHYTTSFITGIQEFSIITFKDTVPFSSIERVSLKGRPHKRFSLLSKFLISAGVLYFMIDQVNNVVVQGQKADLPPTVWKPSLVLVTAGYLLKLARKRSQRIRFPARLVTAPQGSRFYKSDQ